MFRFVDFLPDIRHSTQIVSCGGAHVPQLDRIRNRGTIIPGIVFEARLADLMTELSLLRCFPNPRFATAGRKELGSEFAAVFTVN